MTRERGWSSNVKCAWSGSALEELRGAAERALVEGGMGMGMGMGGWEEEMEEGEVEEEVGEGGDVE